MRNNNQECIQDEYHLLLVDENISILPNNDIISIHSSSVEFVPELSGYELEQFFKSKDGIHTLYISYHPGKLKLAYECGIHTCFLNNGINDIGDFDKTYEIPVIKQLHR